MSSKPSGGPTYADVELPRAGLALVAIELLEDVPVPIDAVCVGCKRSAVKCVRLTDPRDPPTSFRDVCHACQTATWWNTLSTLPAIFTETTERRRQLLDRQDAIGGGRE